MPAASGSTLSPLLPVLPVATFNLTERGQGAPRIPHLVCLLGLPQGGRMWSQCSLSFSCALLLLNPPTSARSTVTRQSSFPTWVHLLQVGVLLAAIWYWCHSRARPDTRGAAGPPRSSAWEAGSRDGGSAQVSNISNTVQGWVFVSQTLPGKL